MECSQTLMFAAQFAASQLLPPSAQFPHFHEAPPLFEGQRAHHPHVGVYESLTGVGRDREDFKRAYDRSVVCIFDSYFEHLTALRPGVEGEFGGALLVSRSQLVVSAITVTANEFIGCHALAGGAIGAIQSDVVCYHCHFLHDAAFYEGGSICVHCPDETDETVVLIQNCEFAGSTARECGGAIVCQERGSRVGCDDIEQRQACLCKRSLSRYRESIRIGADRRDRAVQTAFERVPHCAVRSRGNLSIENRWHSGTALGSI
jgi:hypothetical protein